LQSVEKVLRTLKLKADPRSVQGMVKFGMSGEQRLGISIPELRKLAKELGQDHNLALELWKTGIPEAKILAGMIAEPTKLTEEQMEDWVKDINSWDVCDQTCMNFFEKTPLAWKKIHEWSKRDEEYVKRTAFTLLACLAWHDKKASDNQFIELFAVIKAGSDDNRNYVKKSVSWALRNIGKRNVDLNRAALEMAQEIQRLDSKAARWIASDVIRELESEAVQRRLGR